MTVSNDYDAMKPEIWSKRNQANLALKNIARQQASTKEQANLYNGQKVSRPTSPEVSFQNLTLGDGAYTRQSLTSVKESLTVNKWDASVVTFSDDEIKQIRNDKATVNDTIDRGSYQLNRNLDRTYFAEYSNARNTSSLVTPTNTTIISDIQSVHKGLRQTGVEMNAPWFLNVDAEVTQLIQENLILRQTKLGDSNIRNSFGYMTKFGGFDVFEANESLTWTGRINIATNPSEGDTVIIDGVTFTFNATPSGAGSVDIGATAAESVDNLITLINAPSTTTATGIALSTADASKFQSAGHTLISAVDNTTYIALTSTNGRITLGETFTDTTDNVSDMVLHCLGGRMGAIDLVIQKDIQTEVKPVDSSFKTDYATQMLWGIKTFEEGAKRLIDFQIRTQADTASA